MYVEAMSCIAATDGLAAAIVGDQVKVEGQPLEAIPIPPEEERKGKGLWAASGAHVLNVYYRMSVEATDKLHPHEQYLVLPVEKKMYPFSRDNPLSPEHEAERHGLIIIHCDQMLVNGLTAPNTQYAPKYDFVKLAS